MTNNFGLTTWDEENQTTKPQPKADIPKLDFVRLQEGNNTLRIITAPAKYWFINYDDGSRYGRRVNCSTEALNDATKGNCPTVQAGYKPKKRYFAGVIYRDKEEGDKIGILDMSVMIYEALQNLKEDEEYGMPDSFDINIKKNPEASSPSGYYTVIPRPPKPLSEEDRELISSVGESVITDNLIRLTTPPPVDRVKTYLEKLGWDGSSKAAASSKATVEETHQETTDADYSFNRTA